MSPTHVRVRVGIRVLIRLVRGRVRARVRVRVRIRVGNQIAALGNRHGFHLRGDQSADECGAAPVRIRLGSGLVLG